MATHRLITSSSLLRLETALFQQVREEKRGDAFRPVVVLCASSFLGHYLSREMVRSGSPHVCVSFLTFNDLARSLARRTLLKKQLMPVPEGGKELVARKLVRDLSPQSYFAGVKDQFHLPQVMAATFTDIEDSRIDFAKAGEQANYRSPASHRKVKELAELYRQYSARLHRRMYTEADLLAEAGRQAALFPKLLGTGSLLVYGFYELTGAQREFLHGLAAHVTLTAFLLADEGPRLVGSQDLRHWWRGESAIEERLDTAEPLTDLLTLQTRVFADAGSARADDGSVRVLSCADEISEAREIAREAVRLKSSEGIPFTDMAVVVRDAAAYLPVLATVFEQIGVPHYIREGLPPGDTGVGRSILAALRIPQTNYSRSAVTQWLTLGALDTRTLTSDRTRAPVALWDRLSAEAGIVEGEAHWRDRLQSRLLDSGKSENVDEERNAARQYVAEQVARLRDCIERLIATGNEWHGQRTWTGLADSISAFLRHFHPHSEERDQVEAVLASLRHLDKFGEGVDLPTFAAALEAALARPSRQRGTLGQTGVHLLSLATARHARFRVVFIPGLTEGAFPLVGRQDPILLDEERRVLTRQHPEMGRAGNLAAENGSAALPLKTLRPQEERLLFVLALHAARERVVLSLPRTSAASGAEKVPSYYLLRALEAVAGRPISCADLICPQNEFTRVVYIPSSRLLSHSAATAIDAREFDLGKITSCMASEYPQAGRYLERFSPNFAQALEAEQANWGTQGLTAYDGMLATPECRQALAKVFAETRVYSPTALERYARCPYHFFLSDVLRLREVEDPSSIDELGAREKGDLMHAILHDFYEQMKARKKLPLVIAQIELYRRTLAGICNEHFRRAERDGITGPEASWGLQQKFILQDLQRYIQTEIERHTDWLPDRFECAFGMREGEATVAFPIAGGSVKLRGKIDRLDLSLDGRSVRVIDYKSGVRRHKRTVDLAGGTALQLPLYLFAAASFYAKVDLQNSTADYCYITRRGDWKNCEFTGASLTAKQGDLREIVETIVAGCGDGIFPRCPDAQNGVGCADCEYSRIGDPRHTALWERKQSDPRLNPFRQMRTKV